MINTRLFSQRDLRWSWQKFGFGGGRFYSYGCTVTALTSLLVVAGYDLTPPEVAERLRKVNAFSGDLIIWSRIQLAFPKVKWTWRGYGYENGPVKELIDKKGTPVLVEVLLSGHRHWVLFLGDMKMMDPWNGRIENTGKYPLIGYSLISLIR
jgi:hypothetical protein